MHALEGPAKTWEEYKRRTQDEGNEVHERKMMEEVRVWMHKEAYH